MGETKIVEDKTIAFNNPRPGSRVGWGGNVLGALSLLHVAPCKFDH